jgi:hypothetical protein
MKNSEVKNTNDKNRQKNEDASSILADSQIHKLDSKVNKIPNHSHAWHETWDRPMKIDEDQVHPFTVARMTDHNVRASDNEIAKPVKK